MTETDPSLGCNRTDRPTLCDLEASLHLVKIDIPTDLLMEDRENRCRGCRARVAFGLRHSEIHFLGDWRLSWREVKEVEGGADPFDLTESPAVNYAGTGAVIHQTTETPGWLGRLRAVRSGPTMTDDGHN